MNNMDCPKAPQVVRKVKKKQVKDELDRLKQAEKKKRRLEKALATSAAIRSELEKKKQKKIEEQQRLDEEGAAIAESVALNVLLDEDSDDSCHQHQHHHHHHHHHHHRITLKKNDGFNCNHWDCSSSLDVFMGGGRKSTFCNAYGLGNGEWSVLSEPIQRDFYEPYFGDGGWESAEISASFLAAQAASSLRINDDAQADSLVFNGMFRGLG